MKKKYITPQSNAVLLNGHMFLLAGSEQFDLYDDDIIESSDDII